MNEGTMTQHNRIGWTAKALALYFVVLPLDFVPVQSLGSVTKLVAILPVICLLFESGGRMYWINSISKWLFAFTILATLSMIYTISFDLTIDSLKTLLINVAFVLIISNCKLYSQREQEYLKKALIAGSIFAVGMALIITFSGSGGYLGTGRYTLSFGNSSQDPNYFCGYLLFGYAFFFSKALKEKPFVNFTIAFLFIGISLVSGSRGGFLAFVVCTVAIFALSEKEEGRTKTVLMSIVGVFIALLFVRFVFPIIDASILERFTVKFILEHGTTNRFDIWESLFQSFKNADIFRKIFGHGYGICPLLSYRGYVAHNLYIDNLITVGVIGVFLQISFQISALVAALKNHDSFCFSILLSLMCMCLSLSLVSYKPLWSIMIMIMIKNNSTVNTNYIN